MATIIPIDVGGLLEPTQVTVTTPGTYDVVIQALATSPAVTFEGPGTFIVNSLVSALSDSTLSAIDGANLTVNGITSVLGGVNLLVDGTSTVTLGTGIAAAAVVNAQFTGSGGTFNFEPGGLKLLTTLPTVYGFGVGDHLDFGGASTAGDSIVYTPNIGDTGGTLALDNGAGIAIGAVTLVGLYTQGDFVLGADGIDFACFLRGTRILTDRGEVAVEVLRDGDMVATLANGFAPVRAVRRRSFAGAALASEKVRPVRIAAGALGGGLPRRELWVSPDHGLFLDGALVPAQLLLNELTITQPARTSPVEYFHVELDPHDIIIAEGAASESYLDIGNRGHFGQPGVIALAPPTEPKNWEDACAPLLLGGPQLAAIQARLWLKASDVLADADELLVA